MKADKIVLLLVVLVMLASLAGTYLLFIQRDSVSSKKIAAIQAEIDKVNISLKKADSQFNDMQTQSRSYADSIKGLQEKIDAGDAERRDVSSKVADLMRSVDELKNAGKVSTVDETPATVTMMPETTPSAEPSAETVLPTETSAVDLGQIPVEK